MTDAAAYSYVAERAQSAVGNDDEQLVLCVALDHLAHALRLEDQALTARKLVTALRARDAAQMEFLALLKEPPTAAVRTISASDYHADPS